MKVLRIEGELHWGFWNRYPETSKMQSSYSIFPPTSLIGAIAASIFSLGILKSNGEIFIKDKKFVSPTIILEDFFLTVSAYFKPNFRGFSVEDINKYVTLHFQEVIKNLRISPEYLTKSAEEIPGLSDEEKLLFEVIREEGYVESSPSTIKRVLEAKKKRLIKEQLSEEELKKKENLINSAISKIKPIVDTLKKKGIVTEIERRFLPEYRTGAIQVGKTYFPGEFVITYLLNEKRVTEVFGCNLNKIVLAAWNITRIGSKESIVSINNAEILDAKKLEERRVKTIFYFPKELATDISGNYYIETFWESGWGRDYPRKPVDYVIPGNKAPIESKEIEVKLSDQAIAYRVKEDNEILIVKK
jgi:CRISPR-associated protein Cas5 subtype I-A